MSLILRISAPLVGLALAAAPAPAQSPDLSALSDAELLALLGELDRILAPVPRVAGYGVPSGFGAPHGLFFASVSGTNRSMRRFDRVDGSLALGFGLGDARAGVSVTPVVVVTSVSPDDFGDSGTVGLSLHRELSAPFGPASLAVGIDSLATWGDSAGLEPGAYVALSGLFDVGRPVLATVGYGSGIADSGRSPGGFGGLAVSLGSRASLSLAWAGDEAIGGLTLWPEDSGRVQVSIGIGDLTDEVDGRRLLFSLSYARQGLSGFGRRR
jgi:hypothetical protein